MQQSSASVVRVVRARVSPGNLECCDGLQEEERLWDRVVKAGVLLTPGELFWNSNSISCDSCKANLTALTPSHWHVSVCLVVSTALPSTLQTACALNDCIPGLSMEE